MLTYATNLHLYPDLEIKVFKKGHFILFWPKLSIFAQNYDFKMSRNQQPNILSSNDLLSDALITEYSC